MKIIGKLELVVKDKKVAWHKYWVDRNTIHDGVPDDPGMANILYPYVEGLEKAQDLTTVVANVNKTMKRKDPNGGDSPLGNLVCDAMQFGSELVNVDFVSTNSLGIRADIPPGDITREKLYEVFPFENTISTLYVSGKEIKELFDYNARRSASRGCDTQLQASRGIQVELDCNVEQEDLPDHLRGKPGYEYTAMSKSIKIGSRVIVEDYELKDPYSIFKMATNDYMGRGGSGFYMLEINTTRVDTSISMRDAVIEYFEKLGKNIRAEDFITSEQEGTLRIKMVN